MARRLPAYRPGVQMVRLSGGVLHWVGFVLLCLGSFSAAVLQRGILGLGGDGSLEALSKSMKPGGQMMGWATGAVLCTLAATLAIPVYAKLLCEGWRRTGDKRAFFLWLAGCAVLSEAPYDLAMSGQMLDFSVQNPVWALLLAAVMLEIFSRWTFSSRAAGIAFKAMVLIGVLAWALLLRVYMGAILILLIALFHLAGKRKGAALLGGVVITILQFPAPLGLTLVHWYDGEKSWGPHRLFYFLYPAQLLAFGLAAQWIAG